MLGPYQELSMFHKLSCFILKISVNCTLHAIFVLLYFINSTLYFPLLHIVISLKPEWSLRITYCSICFKIIPGVPDSKESACNAGDPGLITWCREWLPTPVFLLGKSYGQRNLVGYSPWSHTESDMTEQLSFLDPQVAS